MAKSSTISKGWNGIRIARISLIPVNALTMGGSSVKLRVLWLYFRVLEHLDRNGKSRDFLRFR